MASLRSAINKMCTECIYDKYSKGTRLEQIEGCTSKGCPLYQLRPKSRDYSKTTPKRCRTEQIREGV